MIFVNSNTILISAVDTALASLCSAFFQESEGQRDNTLKGFFAYAVEIAVSDTKRNCMEFLSVYQRNDDREIVLLHGSS